MPPREIPPLHTHLTDLLGWTLDRTASLPKSHRFTFGQRVDALMIEAVELCIEAIYSQKSEEVRLLTRLNLCFEKLRVFWRIIHERGWISRQQLFHVMGRIDEAGRMTGGWLKSLEKK